MNRKLLLTFFLLYLITFGYAKTEVGYNLNFQLSRRDFVDTIAIEYRDHQVLVPVEMNGKTYRFLLDTGAGHAVVYDDLLFEGCQPVGTIASRDAIGNNDTVQLVALPPLTLGSLTLTGCQATVQHRAVQRRGIDGIFGFDIVCKGLYMKIDVQNSCLILTDRKEIFAKEKGHTVKYKLDYHVPYFTVKPFKGYAERVLFDTGSRHLYSMNKQSFDKGETACMAQNPLQIEGRATGRHAIGLQGTEPLGEVVFLCLDSLCLGKYSFGDLHTITTQGGSHLGARLLEYGAVTFNPHKKRMIFQPFKNENRVMVVNEQLQKAIVNENGRPVVGLVWEKSEPYKAGLREGDIILKADEQPIRSFADYIAFRPLLGHVYHVIVRDRRGFTKEVKMKW